MSPPLFFQAILRLLVLTALGALYLAEVASLPALGGVAALALGSWWAEELRVAVPGVRRIWDVCTVAFLGYATLDLLVLADSFIVAVIHLLLFLMIYKLYNAQGHRDFLHLFVLTFLALVAASTLTAHFGMLLVFSLYMILAIWGLALLQLKRETELHLPERSRDLLGAPGLVAPSFLISGFGMAVLALVLTLGIFFLIPRVGRTFLSLRGPLGTQATGFTDRVDLGIYGAIQTDPTVVMRISFPEDPNAPARSPDLRWRGVAFDRFDGRAWSLADSGRTPARQIREGQYSVSPFALGLPFISAEIFLEPIGTDVLFGPPRLRAIQGRLPGVRVNGAGGVTLPFPPNSRLRYLAVSQPERVRDDALRHADSPQRLPGRDSGRLPPASGAAGAYPRIGRVAVRRGGNAYRRGPNRWRRIWSSISVTVSTWDGTRAGTRWRTFSSSERRATASTSPPAWWSCCEPWGFPRAWSTGFSGESGTRWGNTWRCASGMRTRGRKSFFRTRGG